ncbi:MAG: DinB family protein [Phycisphaeraceae bacterium]|nr:MAG: DinB family protein [Phycisphaeraceae bacterium]
MPDQLSESRRWVIEAWRRAQTEADYAAPWCKAVRGLTPAQAMQAPAPGRHSIAQIVAHVCFWRAYFVDRARGGERLDRAEIDRQSWPDPGEDEWAGLIERFGETHALVLAALEDPELDTSALQELLMHDCYHVGQVMYVRALLGLKAIG